MPFECHHSQSHVFMLMIMLEPSSAWWVAECVYKITYWLLFWLSKVMLTASHLPGLFLLSLIHATWSRSSLHHSCPSGQAWTVFIFVVILLLLMGNKKQQQQQHTHTYMYVLVVMNSNAMECFLSSLLLSNSLLQITNTIGTYQSQSTLYCTSTFWQRPFCFKSRFSRWYYRNNIK